jgi:hypothetical protein
MSLSTIQNVWLSFYYSNLSITYHISLSSRLANIIWSLVSQVVFIILRVYLIFMQALIIIMKHATFLRLSNMMPKPALIQAELDFQKANIDLKIQQYLLASSQEHSIELYTRFIMATDIGWFIFASVEKIFY